VERAGTDFGARVVTLLTDGADVDRATHPGVKESVVQLGRPQVSKGATSARVSGRYCVAGLPMTVSTSG
jgi:hypothetical protein